MIRLVNPQPIETLPKSGRAFIEVTNCSCGKDHVMDRDVTWPFIDATPFAWSYTATIEPQREIARIAPHPTLTNELLSGMIDINYSTAEQWQSEGEVEHARVHVTLAAALEELLAHRAAQHLVPVEVNGLSV